MVGSRDSISTQEILPVCNVNANTVALMPFGFLRSLHSPEVIFDVKRQWFGEKVSGIYQYARTAKQENLSIMLKPHIWVHHGEYTGKIEMKSEEDWKKLEESYSRFILKYAQVAKEIDADIFSVGTELELFVKSRPHFWKKLIEEVKNTCECKLTYASNWDEFTHVPFWNQLDYIGVDAYFPLSDKESPTVVELEEEWKSHKERIYTLSRKEQKPVLFTEYGYRSKDYATKEPWDSSHEQGQTNLKIQAVGLQAIYNQFWDEDWFAGGFIWKWFPNHSKAGGEQNNQFTPQNKPAEQLLKKLYAR